MADNLIEQFFIDIELNTKGVGKQAKQIDKILETLGNKQFKSEIQREKRKQYAYKKTYEKRKKYLEDLKKLEEFGLPSGNGNPKRPSCHKSPKSPLKVHPEKIKNDKIKAEKAFREKESILAQKALADRLKSFKKEKAALSGMKEKEISEYRTVQKAMDSINKKRTDAATKREIDLAKISHNKNTKAAKEQQRLSSLQTKQHVQRMTQQDQEIQKMKEFYKEQSKAAERASKRQKVIDNQLARIQGTAWYNKFKGAGGDTHGFEKDLRSAMKDGDAARVTNLTNQMKRLTAEQERYNRKLQKTNIIQKGVTDSTRHMIRSYASLYALFEGTVAIKRVGQEYQGLDASMLAAAGSSEAAAKDFEFVNGLVDQMGLSLKDTSDAWVKFKFAAKGKISQEQQEDVFTGLSMFGTSLKVDIESMKRSQKALIQIRNCLAA
ncbi:tail length tape measure protein [Pseudoalteromonas phage H101]|uniref:Tail length tape-measure protein n=1 Tax=Pseudoalteromonas phage H101 TaxID=1654919 RepID=A0A0H4IRL9_9CAUD|nr:tail length tape measure protein [Pseudoalteromonas phage H101]AKO60913.1 hypothetical protein [Pseudoalteromonas phage H101]